MQLIVNITKQIPNASERIPNTDFLGPPCTHQHLNISDSTISTKHKTRHFDNKLAVNKKRKTAGNNVLLEFECLSPLLNQRVHKSLT